MVNTYLDGCKLVYGVRSSGKADVFSDALQQRITTGFRTNMDNKMINECAGIHLGFESAF